MTMNNNLTATDLLRSDHKKVRDLFMEYENTENAKAREDIMAMLCLEVATHTMLEEQIFYPAAKGILSNDGFITESLDEHDRVKILISQLQRLCADEDRDAYDEKVDQLKTTIESHVQEEERLLFPKVEESSLDLIMLSKRMQEMKESGSPKPTKIQPRSNLRRSA